MQKYHISFILVVYEHLGFMDFLMVLYITQRNTVFDDPIRVFPIKKEVENSTSFGI